MEKSKITSIVGLILIFLSGVLFVASLVSRGWMVGEDAIDMVDFMKVFQNISQINGGPGNSAFPGSPNPGDDISMNDPSLDIINQLLKGVKITQKYEYGLKSVSMKIGADLGSLEPQMRSVVRSMVKDQTFKIDYEIMEASLVLLSLDESSTTKLKNFFGDFEKIFYCLVLTAVFCSIACLCAFLKTPCIKVSRKNIILYVTLLTCIVAAISGIASLVIFDKYIYNEHKDDNVLIKVAAGGNAMPAEISGLFGKELEYSKGISFTISIVAEVFAILAVIVNIIELFLKRKESGAGNKSILNGTDGYNLA